MLHKDVLMRQVQQAVQVMLRALAEVIRLRSEERYDEAVQRINEVFGDLGMTSRPVGELSSDELLDFCTTERGFAVDLALGIADLLRQEAELFDELGDEDAAAYSASRSYVLYERALQVEGAPLPLDIGERMSAAEDIASRDAS